VSALFCIHGHFYQPAREHPWLEAIEIDDTAAPSHDWNARIAAECYAPNAAARILDAEGRIDRIVSNYAAISFNVGPTLMRWLERSTPQLYAQILEADRASVIARGYGNAIAQAYNHIIMPLASRRDKMTQVRWGMADFARRFGRRPAGMWLPECAVDRETLEVLAACGITFTILAPHQAARVRALPEGEWIDVRPEVLDTSRAYRCRPASGVDLALFFYERAAAREIAFGPLLQSGDQLAHRLQGLAGEGAEAEGRLVHIATDGETFGHHHRYGEMALAYATSAIEERGGAFTNYAAFLDDYPPTHEVQVVDFTSWSCVHGVERWRSNCGCRTTPEWHQRWRAPLREALDWLKDEIDTLFEDAGAGVFYDPWAARDAYIDVILDRSEPAVRRFIAVQALRPDHPEDRLQALRLLEMQRHAMLMFTSDGWFFDELSRIETVQVLRHAARAMQIAASFGPALEAPFVERLRPAESNLAAHADGAAVYDRLVLPAMVDVRRVAAHYAITSLFRDYPETTDLYAYRVARRDAQRFARGPYALIIGRAKITATVTTEGHDVSYAVLHVGATDVHCCVEVGWDDLRHAAFADGLAGVFEGSTVPEVIRQMDQIFGQRFYTLRDLFTDERREVLTRLSAETVQHLESSYRRLFHESRGLMKALRDAEVPLPREFLIAAEFILAADLRRALTAPAALSVLAWDAVAEARAWGILLSPDVFEPLIRERIERHLRDADGLFLVDNVAEVQRTLDFARDAGIKINLWQAQNLFGVLLAPYLTAAPDDVRSALEQTAERLHFSLESLRRRVAQ
jgi:alpha-amylase/alpha-mannosidase (GH57 family)